LSLADSMDSKHTDCNAESKRVLERLMTLKIWYDAF